MSTRVSKRIQERREYGHMRSRKEERRSNRKNDDQYCIELRDPGKWIDVVKEGYAVPFRLEFPLWKSAHWVVRTDWMTDTKDKYVTGFGSMRTIMEDCPTYADILWQKLKDRTYKDSYLKETLSKWRQSVDTSSVHIDDLVMFEIDFDEGVV